jgi:hypothetical protein
MRLLVEPRDTWIGVFWGKDATYVVLVPCIVLKFPRRRVDGF